MKLITFLITVLIFSSFLSCGQTAGLEVEKEPFAQVIYDTCHLRYDKYVPDDFRFKIRSGYILDRSIDSILYINISSIFNDIVDSTSKPDAYRVSEINKCNKLGFLEVTKYLDELPDEIDFTQFPELRYVDFEIQVSDKHIVDLLSTAKKLKGLELVLNSKIPDCICELDSLRYLQIINRGNAELPECMKDMKGLKYLSIAGAGIGYDGKLNDVIWNIPSLELLTVDGGGLVDIKSTIRNMNRLKQLNISTVDSIVIPNEFMLLDSLELLSIGWVPSVINIPYNFSKLKRLKGLKIYQTGLSEFPIFNSANGIIYLQLTDVLVDQETFNFNFEYLTEIEYLFITSSKHISLAEFPSQIHNLGKLKNIELGGFGFSNSTEFLEFQKKVKYYDQLNEPNVFKNEFTKTFGYYRALFRSGTPSYRSPKMY